MIKELYYIRDKIADIGWQLESWNAESSDAVILRFLKVEGDNSRRVELMTDEEDLSTENFIQKLHKFLQSSEKVKA